MIWLSGLVLTILGFLLGRVFSQSEIILADKRRVYETFLKACYTPNEAHLEIAEDRQDAFQSAYPALLLYASKDVTLALSVYMDKFHEAQSVLAGHQQPLHPAYKQLAKAHNDVILEMRRDGFAFSAFAYAGKSRLPGDALEKAKKAVGQ